ncbi:NADH dehydrogenase [ubiquinone] 1 alpha subcomplex subunit 8 [Diabrotica virgifera virgifera]|uniref:NADH dehydrogenase [ubiquinone] 1 alpha subcomplex subunit 8 n=1 Tax=Diabrotica virgifera virgifera TaxID=50390 RepID=A0A6P7FDZ1_DIAVI|nr:NADH dehydrogenase [ubiquinone] 1 alpha subcomplex subunit 8 [Diabrotica virgifera virgifera]
MGITDDVHLPTEEELTVQEIPLSGPALKAGAFHVGKTCEWENNEFILCRDELKDPRKCINEGKAVTSCAMNFFRKIKATCADEFMQYVNCLDKSSPDQALVPCRKTQAVFDKCVKDNLGLDRPPYDYFNRVHVHKTERPRPPVEGKTVYEDATPGLPEDVPKPEAKYGSRYLFMW